MEGLEELTSGVPVRRKSPASSVHLEEASAMSSATPKIMFFVFPSCLRWPFTNSRKDTFCTSSIFSLGMKAEIGHEVSNPLASAQGCPCSKSAVHVLVP